MAKRRRAAVTALATGLLTMVTACSSSGSSADSGGAAGSAGDIVIGNIGSYTGAASSSLVNGEKVIKAWAHSINDSGGIGGHKIRLVVKDTQSSPSAGLTMVKQMVEQDHVVAIVGEQDTNDQAWASYVQAKGIPVIGGLTVSTPWITNPDFFSEAPNVIASYYGVAQLAKSVGSKFAVLYCAEAPACGQAAQLTQALASTIGLQVPFTAKVSAAAPDYTALCQQLNDAGVQSYQVAAGAAVVIRVAKQCRAQGVTAKQVTQDGTLTDDSLKESALDGTVASESVAPWFDSTIPAVKQYQDAVAKYAPDLGGGNGPNAMYAWVSGKLFEKAAAVATDTITAQSLRQSLWQMKGETLDGLAAPLTFTEGKPALINCYFPIAIEGGKFVAPQHNKPQCAPDAVVSAVAAKLAG